MTASAAADRVEPGFSELAAALDAVADAIGTLGPDDVSPFVAALQQHANRVSAVMRRATEVAIRLEVPKRSGYRSAAAWLAANTGTRRAVAQERCRQVSALEQLPALRRAADAGLVHDEQLGGIARCYEAAPEAFDEVADREFTEQAVNDTPYALARALQAWRQLHVPARRAARSTMSAIKRPDGTVHGTFEFVGSDAPLFVALTEGHIGRSLRAKRDGDASLQDLDVDHLRARALLDLLDAATRRPLGRRPTAPDRYRVCLQVDPTGRLGDAPPEAMCDASFFRLVMDADSEPLDIGRTSNVWTDAQRQAVAQRDRSCRFGGCDLPASWCDVHHIVPWDAGGRTDVTNGVLLCRHHHVFVHANGWRYEAGTFIPPEGAVVGRRPVAWPPAA